jgi:two-component system NtrC family response regulator
VVLVGEIGSGRTSLARAIHVASLRHDAPLIELDVGVYQETVEAVALFGDDGHGGAWASAGGGSLVLCGVVEATTVHDLLIERLAQRATHRDPRLLIVAADPPLIPARLSALLRVQVCVPPLRERPGDVVLLAKHFSADHPIASRATQLLEHYVWPGNITELRGVMERAVQLAGSDPIDVAHLPMSIQRVSEPAASSAAYLPPEGVNLEQVEQALIRQALERAHGNKSKAAELLGLTRHTLLYRMEKYGITAPERS